MAFDKGQMNRMNLDPRLFSVDEEDNKENQEEGVEYTFGEEDSGIEIEPVDDDVLDALGEEDPFPDPPRQENAWVNTNNAWTINNNEWNSGGWNSDNEWVPREPSDLWDLVYGESWPSESTENIDEYTEVFLLLIYYNGYSWVRNKCESEDHKSFITKISMQSRSLSELREILENLNSNEKKNISEIIRHLITDFKLSSDSNIEE